MQGSLEHTSKACVDSIPPGTFYALDSQEVSGMVFSVSLWLRIQWEFPEVADEYRSGLSLSDIIRKYQLEKIYSIQPKTAENAPRYALGWYQDTIELSTMTRYEGLIPLVEYKALGKEHNQSTGRMVWILMRETKNGMFSISTEERRSIGSKSGNKWFQNKTWIHAQTLEERRDIWRLGAIASWWKPWSALEEASIAELIKNPEYQRKTRINAQKIAMKINADFHEWKAVRTTRSVVKLVSQRLTKILPKDI